MSPQVFNFYPQNKGHGVTTYALTLNCCPWEVNEYWFDCCVHYSRLINLLDPYKSSVGLLLAINYYKDFMEVVNGK